MIVMDPAWRGWRHAISCGKEGPSRKAKLSIPILRGFLLREKMKEPGPDRLAQALAPAMVGDPIR